MTLFFAGDATKIGVTPHSNSGKTPECATILGPTGRARESCGAGRRCRSGGRGWTERKPGSTELAEVRRSRTEGFLRSRSGHSKRAPRRRERHSWEEFCGVAPKSIFCCFWPLSPKEGAILSQDFEVFRQAGDDFSEWRFPAALRRRGPWEQ